MDLIYPIRIGTRTYVRGRDKDHDKRMAIRKTKLRKMYNRWHTAAIKVLSDVPMQSDLSWVDMASYISLHKLESFNADVDRLRLCEAIGSTWDVRNIHLASHNWYGESMGYRTDCTMYLVTLLNNIRFCREIKDNKALSRNLEFPLINYVMGQGPTYPEPHDDTVFGQRDRQFTVHDGGTLWYFEAGDFNLGRELIVDRVL